MAGALFHFMPIKRCGYTLVEIVLALFIFTVGALAVAAAMTAYARSTAVNIMRDRATRIASSRIEVMRAGSCAAARGGSELIRGVRSAWIVIPSATEVVITEEASYDVAGRHFTQTYRGVLPCL